MKLKQILKFAQEKVKFSFGSQSFLYGRQFPLN